MASIRLDRYVSSEFRHQLDNGTTILGYPLRVEAHGNGISSDVFIYQQVSPDAPIPGDTFSTIASVTQLQDIPIGRPVQLETGYQIPFYRRSSVELFLPTAPEVEEVWRMILDAVQTLVRNYNAMDRLVNMDSAVITDTTTHTETPMINPVNLTLSYRPAGSPTYENEEQGISNPNPALRGWLPVSEMGAGLTIPTGAKYFYNPIGHPDFQVEMGRIGETDLHDRLALYYNGLRLPYGVIWKATPQTIFWMDFSPSQVGGMLDANNPVETVGKAPWPIDYLGASAPGSISPHITLTLYPTT